MKNETIPYGKLLFFIWEHLFLLRDTLGIVAFKKKQTNYYMSFEMRTTEFYSIPPNNFFLKKKQKFNFLKIILKRQIKKKLFRARLGYVLRARVSVVCVFYVCDEKHFFSDFFFSKSLFSSYIWLLLIGNHSSSGLFV